MRYELLRQREPSSFMAHLAKHGEGKGVIMALRCIFLGFSSETSKKFTAEVERGLHTTLWARKRGIGDEHCHISTTKQPNTQQARQNYADLLRAMGCNEEEEQIEEKQ
jgi:hypothetical protein